MSNKNEKITIEKILERKETLLKKEKRQQRFILSLLTAQLKSWNRHLG